MTSDRSHLTAITRKAISKPCRILLKKGLIVGRVLDYGCGRGYDAAVSGFDKYDPYYFPALPYGKYDTIICSYVLNVLPKSKEKEVLGAILSFLHRDGRAYVTVRRDQKNFVEGLSSKGTYQRMVRLDFPVIYEDIGMCIYEIRCE